MFIVLVMALCIAVGVPVVVFMAQGVDVAFGPNWLWITVFCGFLVAHLLTLLMSSHPSRPLRIALYLTQQALAVASVLLLDGLMVGFLPVILVFGAALGPYVLPLWGTLAVVVVNTGAIFAVTVGSSFENQALSAVFYAAIQLVSVFSTISWRAQERAQQELQRAHVELGATTALLEQSTRAEERLRISRDLHDVAGHQLTALALELEIASHHADGPAREHVLKARGIAKSLLGDVRETVSQLRDEHGSLEAALRRATDGVVSPRVVLSVDAGLAVDVDRATALVRATQEVVTNAIRHAESASTLRISVSQDAPRSGDEAQRAAETIVFDATDDGWGPAGFEIGNGLRGMRERAEALGGSASFGRGDEGGFRARMEVPA